MPARALGNPAWTIGACACLFLAAPAIADRQAVQLTLTAMQNAVLNGDAELYLRHVDTTDPTFAKEQHNWASDLRAHRPATFALTIVDPKEDQPDVHDFGQTRARFRLKMSWSFAPAVAPERDGASGPASAGSTTRKPSPQFVVVPVRFNLDPASNRWLFAGEDWLEMTSDTSPHPHHPQHPPHPPTPDSLTPQLPPSEPHTQDPRTGAADSQTASTSVPVPASRFRSPDLDSASHSSLKPEHRRSRVLFMPGLEQVAKRVIELLPEVRTHVDAGLGEHVPHEQVVKLYSRMDQLQASIYLSYADPLGGWNEPGEAIKLLVRPNTPDSRLKPLLAHEYAHVVTFELGPEATNMPWWVLEGVAELASEDFGDRGKRAALSVRQWAARDRLSDWASLSDFRSVPGDKHRYVYAQGHDMLAFVSARFGPVARNQWLRSLAQGTSIDSATRNAFNTPFAELDAAWRAGLKPASEP